MEPRLIKSFTFFAFSIILFFIIVLFPIQALIARYLVAVMTLCPVIGIIYAVRGEKGTNKSIALIFNIIALFTVSSIGIILTTAVKLG
ncbi:hypothetical protein [Bacillus testis]|uniref:hypothetical protein n=1 Tax=Bacillus testis TaxID=1622072 RepID=UPI00067F5B15|nr:hypothetical protein [Bacillus testis]